jgi:hypothetical protein
MIGRRIHLWLLCASLALAGCAAAPAAASAAFGLKSFHVSYQQALSTTPETVEVLGPPDFQAGSHPYQMTVSEEFNSFIDAEGTPKPEGLVKDINIEFPSGVIGNANAVPQCPMVTFENSTVVEDACPADTQVGVVSLQVNNITLTVPLSNLAPAAGHAAQFGVVLLAPEVLSETVRNTGEYVLDLEQRNINETLPIIGLSTTIWGVPADSRHDPFRGKCLGDPIEKEETGRSLGSCPSGAPVEPLLTMPGSCAKPLTTSITADSWEAPEVPIRQSVTTDGSDGMPSGVSGCEQLEFNPTVTVRPESAAADSPTGVAIEVDMPYSNAPTTLAEASLREIATTLPVGMSINPAAAAGLAGCTLAQVGLSEEGPPGCSNESQVGSFEVQTPLLSNPLQGAIYIAQPPSPFVGAVGVYLAGEADGVSIKMAGQLSARSTNGQLTFSLDNAPQLPITALKLDLWGGSRAAIANPPACGVFEATAALTPYSAPDSGGSVARSNSLAIDEACGGQFAPSLRAGTTSSAAGRQSGFAFQLTRTDQQPYLQNIGIALPPGLQANIASVAHCGEGEIAVDMCPATSEVGTVTAADGAGSIPNYLSGHVYLTGPYGGAPYGIAIVMPAVVGPFDLGTVVVRGEISIDLATSSNTISVEPFPTIVGGVPLRIKSVEMTTAPDLMVNPTSCAAEHITGIVSSRADTSVTLSTPYQAVGCAGLAFTPGLTATAEAPASRRDGVGLDLAITFPAEPQASASKLVVELPPQVRGRLSTIQQTCRAQRFAQSPNQCPPSALVGSARVTTKVLPSPLAGPVYLVSGEGLLPRLVMTVQGDGISEELTGKFVVSKHGVTSAIVEGMPDAPISSIAINLPSGPHSVLGTTTDLCKRHLTVGYTFTAASGAHFKRKGKLAVARGCSTGRAHKASAARRGHGTTHSPSRFVVRHGDSAGKRTTANKHASSFRA